MRYVQLRAFHHVATCGGFSRAAEELHLTQPAISDQVRKLEEEYDILLFNRLKKQVSLTPEGVRLFDITRRMFDAEEQARDLLSESRTLRAGTLRIVADSTLHVIAILARFRARYPGVAIEISAGNSQEVIDRLYAFEADIGVLGAVPDSRDFVKVPLNATPISAFVARGHPLAERPALTLAELADQPLVMRERGSKTRLKLETAAAAAGVALTPAIIAEGREAVREIVASGTGVGVVSVAEFGSDPRLVLIPIADRADLVMEEALICLRERRNGALVTAFLNVARAQVPSASV
ncbi:LysR substrate-binding domain-containing protein [Pseudooceanicola sp. LIPI14-2-Ac024]|uniref:LysR substrate-binding domain-containing protein n=1 Tax=Pseudooceanicola sp. LIPI14-2-Ac024 TaxID=3344875 RepID=UPI0035CF5A09